MKKPENIIVTGGAGFVGYHLINKLASAYPEAAIISLDNYFTGSTENHIENDRITYLTGHTKDIYQIWAEQKLPNPDAIFHLGEYSRIVQSFEDIDLVWDYNMHGTKEVVKFCAEHNARLVYAGSSSKFGNDGADENLSPYAWIKAKNIEYIENFSNWFGLDYVITYFYNVYGPRHIRKGKYATVIGIFESLYEQGKPLTVVSPGTQERDFTHVEDIVNGVIACYEKGHGDGYLIGAQQACTIIEVAEMFDCEVVLVPARQGERVLGVSDNAKVRALGWEPKYRLGAYIADFCKSVKQVAG